MVRLVVLILTLVMALLPPAVLAQHVDFRVRPSVEGIALDLPVGIDFLPQGEVMGFRAGLDLTDLIGKADAIVRASGLDRPDGVPGDFNYNGTLAELQGDQFWLKYHFEFHSKASVELWLRPSVEGDTVRLAATDARLNVSNDLWRALVDGLGLRERIADQLRDTVNTYLAGPDAAAALPAVIKPLKPTISAARFATLEGRPMLVVEGTLQLSFTGLAQLVIDLAQQQ